MALYNLARVTTATTGTGTITLGSAVSGFLTFASAGVPDGAVVTYAIKDGSNSEIGRGTYTLSGTTLTRTVLKSTNSNTAISLSGSAEVVITAAAEDLIVFTTPGGRLTLTTATPVLTSTTSAQSTVYYTPYQHRYCPLYDGYGYVVHDLGGELSNLTTATTSNDAGPAATTTNSNYDLFVWYNSTAGAYRLTRGPLWTSDTGRGTGAGTTELERVKGILLNKVAITNGPAANRGTYVGTIRTNGTSTVDFIFGGSAAGGTAAVFGVWNAYNRVTVSADVRDTTDSWSYTTATFRAANASNTMRVSFVAGLNEDSIAATYSAASSTGSPMQNSIGYDSTSTASGTYQLWNAASIGPSSSDLRQLPGLGFHYLQALEKGAASAVFYGDNGSGTVVSTSLAALWRC